MNETRASAERLGPTSPPLSDSLLRVLWNHRRISRADIARLTGLSRSTVSEVMATLLRSGLVSEVGVGSSSGGRRPIVLEFQDAANVILGVEMGAAHVAVALTDLRGHVLEWRSRPHPVRDDPTGTRNLIKRLCVQCFDEAARDPGELVGIGVAVPSPVDPARPDALSEIVLPAWRGRLGLDALQRHYDVPLLIDNDANLGALAEQWWGAGRGVRDLAYIKIATGIGSGHIIDRHLYRGATGVAGEIGHVAIDPHGERCICGLRGCLATLVGAAALVKRAQSLMPEYPDSALARGETSIEAIEDAAIAGDPLARRITEEAAEHLGIAIAGLLNLMNPAVVVLGGGLARVGDLLLAPLRDTVRQRTLVSSLAASEITVGELGPRAIAIGAATLVLDAGLANPHLFPARREQAPSA
ncbi:MAG: ROK family transcriptional regulator [bacterium]